MQHPYKVWKSPAKEFRLFTWCKRQHCSVHCALWSETTTYNTLDSSFVCFHYCMFTVFLINLLKSLFCEPICIDFHVKFKWHLASHGELLAIYYLFTTFIAYTGAGHIIRISSKGWFISQIPFKKWNLYNVYIHSTQTDIFQVFIYFNFDDYNGQLMKTPNSVSQKIRILLKTNTKKGFLEILANWKV